MGRVSLVLLSVFVALALDPSSLAATAPATSACSVQSQPVQDSWTEQEAWVWAQVCAGREANLQDRYCPGRNPGAGACQPANQILRPQFLESILLDEPYRGSIPRQGVHIIGATFEEVLDLRYAKVDANVFLENSTFKRAVVLTGFRTPGLLAFDGSTFLGVFRVNGAQIGGLLSLAGDTRANQGLDMDGLRAGYLALKGQGVRGTFDAPVFTSPVWPAIWLSHARIDGDIDLSDATIDSGLNMANVEVGDELRLRYAILKGRVIVTNAKIGGDLALEGSKKESGDSIPRHVDLTGTSIGGALTFGSTGYGPMQWPEGSRLILRNVTAGDVQDGITRDTAGVWTGSWPRIRALDGFAYENLGGADSLAIAMRPAEWLANDWLGCPERFSPEPYERLASTLSRLGYQTKAEDILYNRKNCERHRASYPNKLWLTVQWALIGYGHRIERAWAWVLVITLLGAWLLKLSRQGDEDTPLYRGTYSLGMLLPMIELSETHKKVQLTGWVRYYFYFHKLMGWVLASFLVAGLAGLTK
jgi:hypothetical protein